MREAAEQSGRSRWFGIRDALTPILEVVDAGVRNPAPEPLGRNTCSFSSTHRARTLSAAGWIPTCLTANPSSIRHRSSAVTYKLMSLATIQIARLLGLVRGIEVLKLDGTERPSWGVLIRGRGFERVLQDDILIAPTLIRPLSAYTPRPRAFFSAGHAKKFIRSMGLTPVGWARTLGSRR